MKKFLSIFLSILLLFSFSSCAKNKTESKNNSKKTIVTTIFPFYDFAKNIVGDKMDVKLLIAPGQSAHDFKNNITIKKRLLISFF